MEPVGMDATTTLETVSSLEQNCVTEEKVDKPSDCKIPKTESGDCENKAETPSEVIEVKVVYNKNKYNVNAPSNTTIADFKKQLQGLVGVPVSMQKLMYKGLLQDNQTLISSGITKGAKIMLVGSTLNDVLAVSYVTKQDVAEAEKAASTKEPLSKQKIHRKVLDKGIPDDVMPGIKSKNESLPPVPLSGMLNKHSGKVRLTFKLEADQLWLSTKERTEKLPMGSIKNIVSEPIEGHEEYHVMGLQLGPTEASRYWIYWVPAQYIEAIKNAVLGQWQLF
ncbi:PREDICTED: ubiquitin domain-containing protein UBFD1-like isoform X2 [Nicrophorus vespilloides]|uniref:Ubiquitin domain-containing protein UBFD1-like isoform X2 n=1 Tax=Nicrophorus vespilloides TaxID=110193 RepID=A0ABM1N0I7_NICVS|nr:PREDICTED: ubiquitin domain-containing protein UBFD1-like isoform X2 [Nicrophorus vespilloides]